MLKLFKEEPIETIIAILGSLGLLFYLGISKFIILVLFCTGLILMFRGMVGSL